MACGGCGGQKKNMDTFPEVAVPNPEGVSITGDATAGGTLVPCIREYCPRCTFKHLAYAYVALEEADHGYPEHIALAQQSLVKAGFVHVMNTENLRAYLDSKARAVGHLVHAMEECPDRELAEKIRSAYTAILDGEDQADILTLLQQLEESNETA